MKELYVKPIFLIEEFVPNKVVAACANNQTVGDAKCFIGGTTETEKIITDSCNNSAKYVSTQNLATAGYVTHPYGKTGSMVGGTSYSVPEGAVGVLVWCAKDNKYSTAAWSDNGVHVANTVTLDDSVHVISTSQSNGPGNNGSGHSTMGLHCHVLPVYGSNVQLS